MGKNKIGRNDPCPCGSGKKYKNCCLKNNRKLDSNQYENDSNNLIENNDSIQEIKTGYNVLKKLRTLKQLGYFDNLESFGLNNLQLDEAFKKFDDMEDSLINSIDNLNVPDKFNQHFSSLGWIAHESMNFDIMKEAVKLADNGLIDEAEDILVENINDSLDFILNMIKNIDIFKCRYHLITLAKEDYLNNRYYSCVLLLLTIIDGIVADCNEIDGNKSFFADGEEIYAWDSIAAHKSGLTEIRKLFYQNRGKTNKESIQIPYRNGILHGRDLEFNNKKIASKLWATLLALKDGIISIRNKSKTPKEEKQFNINDFMEEHAKNEKIKKYYAEWKPRKLKPKKDFLINGTSEEYEDNSPEKSLVEFFEFWKDKNYGKVAQKLMHIDYSRKPMGKLIYDLKNEIFDNNILISHEIVNITDDNIVSSNILVKLKIKTNNEEKIKEIEFRMISEDENGEFLPQNCPNSNWKIPIHCFNRIND
ncbi:MAG: SEC-C domain-containing protein [Methanobrevibacter sp.]|jgi:hypothetical protein|nr:SEC-C domain-containing protein [Candidatus Methanoflexus mossambicus]